MFWIFSLGLSLFHYDPSGGSHIVAQEFPYIGRDAEAEDVVQFMEARQGLRQSGSESLSDKAKNPLIALPGSPGVGKSTFLVHFPITAAYRRYRNETSPIV